MDGRPYGSNRQKRCPKSSATFIGLRSRTLAAIAERISHSHPALTVPGATRIEHHCGTCGDREANDFFCSALAAHIARPIPHRSSQFSRPAFFYRSFFWALLQANSCVRQLRGFCFPGSALHTIGFPPRMQPLALEAAALAFGCPRKMGQKKETFSCPTYMLSGIAFGAVRSPVIQLLKHVVRLPGHSRNGGMRRRRRRV